MKVTNIYELEEILFDYFGATTDDVGAIEDSISCLIMCQPEEAVEIVRSLGHDCLDYEDLED